MNNNNNNITKFNNLFQDIENILKTGTNSTWEEVLNKAADSNSFGRVIRKYRKDLKVYIDIRNILVHHHRTGIIDNKQSAIFPSDHAIEELIKIHSALTNPDKALMRATLSKDMLLCQPEALLADVLSDMHSRNISQIPIVSRDGCIEGMLTLNMISKWLATKINEGIVEFDNVLIKDIIQVIKTEKFFVKNRDISLDEVISLFSDGAISGVIPVAVLITETGSRSEKMLGIFTAWDIPEAIRHLNKS